MHTGDWISLAAKMPTCPALYQRFQIRLGFPHYL